MKVLVTGAGGQLGHDMCEALAARDIAYRGIGRAELDITDRTSTRDLITAYRPDAVIHCAAWTAVDRAEEEPAAARRANVEGSRNVAMACKEIGAKMLYVSTDYVFPGAGTGSYEPDDPTGPLNVYGQTKLEGEQAVQTLLERHFIVRTSWVFGKHGDNFVKTMLKLSETKTQLSVVCDQIGSPTYTVDLAGLLCDMIGTERYGVYHATNEGVCSRAEFAQEIFRRAGRDVKVDPVPSDAYPTQAVRPLNSKMSKDKLTAMGFHRLPPWPDALERYLRSL